MFFSYGSLTNTQALSEVVNVLVRFECICVTLEISYALLNIETKNNVLISLCIMTIVHFDMYVLYGRGILKSLNIGSSNFSACTLKLGTKGCHDTILSLKKSYYPTFCA